MASRTNWGDYLVEFLCGRRNVGHLVAEDWAFTYTTMFHLSSCPFWKLIIEDLNPSRLSEFVSILKLEICLLVWQVLYSIPYPSIEETAVVIWNYFHVDFSKIFFTFINVCGFSYPFKIIHIHLGMNLQWLSDLYQYFYSCFNILDIILDYPCLFAGHLTSKSDVYSFGVVLLEMMTGRRSMDKNRPNGEHNLVEWARPHLGERRRFYRLIDPRLEGNFSVKGAQKVSQLAYACLSRDSKARPMMSEVVEALKPLVNLKDMASSSYFFQTMQTERAMAHSNSLGARNGSKLQGSFGRNGQQPMRSLSHGAHASSYHQSPKPSGR